MPTQRNGNVVPPPPPPETEDDDAAPRDTEDRGARANGDDGYGSDDARRDDLPDSDDDDSGPVAPRRRRRDAGDEEVSLVVQLDSAAVEDFAAFLKEKGLGNVGDACLAEGAQCEVQDLVRLDKKEIKQQFSALKLLPATVNKLDRIFSAIVDDDFIILPRRAEVLAPEEPVAVSEEEGTWGSAATMINHVDCLLKTPEALRVTKLMPTPAHAAAARPKYRDAINVLDDELGATAAQARRTVQFDWLEALGHARENLVAARKAGVCSSEIEKLESEVDRLLRKVDGAAQCVGSEASSDDDDDDNRPGAFSCGKNDSFAADTKNRTETVYRPAKPGQVPVPYKKIHTKYERKRNGYVAKAPEPKRGRR